MNALSEPLDFELDSASTKTVDGKTFKTSLDDAAPEIRERILSDFQLIERVASGGFQAVLWPACGENSKLRDQLQQLESNRARALCLFLHDKPKDTNSASFDRAEALYDCGASRPNGRTWKLFQMSSFSRNWTPPRNMAKRISGVVEKVLKEQGEPDRAIEVVLSTHPVRPASPTEDLCHTFFINISGTTETEQGWQDGHLVHVPKTPNRTIIICITPFSKGMDCGWNAVESPFALDVMKKVAAEVLSQKETPLGISNVPVALRSLSKRPKSWPRPPEYGITSVQVKKLVLSAGPGTRTYYVPAKSPSDAYDVAPPHLNAARMELSE